jgi:hypothetical protein
VSLFICVREIMMQEHLHFSASLSWQLSMQSENCLHTLVFHVTCVFNMSWSSGTRDFDVLRVSVGRSCVVALVMCHLHSLEVAESKFLPAIHMEGMHFGCQSDEIQDF